MVLDWTMVGIAVLMIAFILYFVFFDPIIGWFDSFAQSPWETLVDSYAFLTAMVTHVFHFVLRSRLVRAVQILF
jgi:hypothetical protein